MFILQHNRIEVVTNIFAKRHLFAIGTILTEVNNRQKIVYWKKPHVQRDCCNLDGVAHNIDSGDQTKVFL